MIPVAEVAPGVFERIGGNPILTSLDRELRAPLLTILDPTWSDEDRAKFGIYMAKPFVEPDGKVAVRQPRYEKRGSKVVEVYEVEDYNEPQPRPDPLAEIRAELAALGARIAALESKS